jgi:hypothetical protein
MSNQLAWITQPAAADPWLLLGVAPGESDARRIEEAAIERSAEARRYQLSHPLEASRRLEAIARAADGLLSRSPAQPQRRRPERKKSRTVLIVTKEDGESVAWELKPRRLRLIGQKPEQQTRLLLLGADGKVFRLHLTARSARQLAGLLAHSAAADQSPAPSENANPSPPRAGGRSA